MLRTTWLLLALVLMLATACGATDQGAAADVPSDTTVDARPDAPDAAEPTPDAPDVDAREAATPETDVDADLPEATSDTFDALPETDAAPETDTTAPTVFAAVPGARCTPASRLGLVQVIGNPWSAGLDASAVVYDRLDAWMPGPKLSDAACSFFEQADPAFCGTCPPDQFCAPDATCQAKPAAVGDVVLTLTTGGQTQTFEANGGDYGAWGAVTLPGRTFALTVTWGGLTLTLSETTVPEPLTGTTQTLEGGYDEPTALDLTWTPPLDGASVFTHIPINHHAAGPTFTECTVDAAAGALHIDGAMLTPLAVVTGLEFQGIEHTRFAAAQTPAGCVEVRFGVQQVVN